MKITKITEEEILFDNGNKITYCDNECGANNYPDFSQLEDTCVTEVDFNEKLNFELEDWGFTFGDNTVGTFFVPCYSIQNGYYSNCLDILYQGKKVLEVGGEVLD